MHFVLKLEVCKDRCGGRSVGYCLHLFISTANLPKIFVTLKLALPTDLSIKKLHHHLMSVVGNIFNKFEHAETVILGLRVILFLSFACPCELT